MLDNTAFWESDKNYNHELNVLFGLPHFYFALSHPKGVISIPTSRDME